MPTNGSTHPKVVVPGDNPPQIQDSPHLERLSQHADVVVYRDSCATSQQKLERAKDAEVLINSRGLVTWPSDVLRQLPKLRLIATCSIGTDMIDLVAANELGILVSNQPGRTAPVVAEHAFGLMFALAKRTTYFTEEMRCGRWPRMDHTFLTGKTLGIIGTGSIGSELARLARAIGMKVIAWTFRPSPERATRLGIEYVELDTLLRTADVVSLNLKLTETTRGLIGHKEFQCMKQNTLFVNVARGPIVDTIALVDALNSGHLGGAAIDVFDEEPIPPDHPLLSCAQVVLTPHCADMTPEGVNLLNEGVVDNVIAFLKGHPQNVVI